MTCATMVIKGLEKFLETQPDIVQQKCSREYFIFIYVAYEMNIA